MCDSNVPSNKVERIYTTRGESRRNENEVFDDKMVGVVINGKIHWIDTEYATLDELDYTMQMLNVTLENNGTWENIIDGSVTIDKKVTRINMHHDDLVCPDSSYMKRSKRNSKNKLFWPVHELQQGYFS